jgi:hypothetical protein
MAMLKVSASLIPQLMRIGARRPRVWGDFIVVYAIFIWCFGLIFGSQTHVETC